jgi:glycosyltransferase involved in cell wall biosynthesis
MEICISDNGSKDGTYKLLKKYTIQGLVRIRRNRKNMGYDWNAIAVLKMAWGKYCWMIGDDDIIIPDNVSKILFALRGKEYIAGLIAAGRAGETKKIVRSFQEKEYSVDAFIDRYISYLENSKRDVNVPAFGFMSCFLFNTNLLEKTLKKLKDTNCYGFCHISIFFNIISSYKGNVVFLSDPPVIFEGDDKIFLLGESIEMFCERRINASKKLHINKKLYDFIVSWIEQQRKNLFIMSLVTLIGLKGMVSLSLYRQMKNKVYEIEKTVHDASFLLRLFVFLLKQIEKTPFTGLLQIVPPIRRYTKSIKGYERGIIKTNEEREAHIKK